MTPLKEITLLHGAGLLLITAILWIGGSIAPAHPASWVKLRQDNQQEYDTTERGNYMDNSIVPSKFKDKFGNIKPNSWDKQSENPTTFNTAFALSLYPRLINISSSTINSRLTHYAHRALSKRDFYGVYRTMESDSNERFSLDEKISMACFGYYLANTIASLNSIGDKIINPIKIFRNPFKNKFMFLSHYRPDVMAVILYAKLKRNKFRDFFLKAIIRYKVLRSCKEFAKNPQRESSGAQLAYIITTGLKLHKIRYECEELLGWSHVFNIYYPEEDHPTRILWEDRN